ncbi:MAG: tripartite tricarboxylate transporter substrate binding protein [Microbacteriaceae bacterium]
MSMLKRALAITATVGMAVTLVGCSSGGSSSEKSDSAPKYPTRDITLTVQAAPGGGSDLASRTIAKVMEKELGVSIVVENRPGASGSLAVKYVSGLKPDGYHIGFTPVELAMFDHLGYDVSPDSVELLAEIMNQPGTIAVPTDSPYKSLKDLMEAAKTKEITVSNSGAGSSWEAATKILGQLGGVKFTLVPFDGGAPAVTAAMGNKVDAVVAGAGETHTGVESGKLRVLAIFSPKPHPVFSDIPTAKSQGYDIDFGSWGGLYSPKGLPDNVKKTLEDAIAKAVKDPAFTDVISATGTIVTYKDAADFTKFVNDEYDRFGKALK